MSILPGESFRAFAEAYFQTRLAATHPTIPIKFGDSPFKQPATTWAAFWILPADSFKASLSKVYVDRTPGLIQIDIMVPQDSGHAVGDRLAEQCGRFFTDRAFATEAGVARFRGVSIKSMGVNGGFYRASARVEFEHDVMFAPA